MTRGALALLCLCALTACGAAPSKEAAIQTALEAHVVARDAARAACLVALSDRSITREEGFDEYCTELIRGCPP